MFEVSIDDEVLIKAIEHTRFAANARNEQILRYTLINDKRCNELFITTNLPSFHKVAVEQAPSAYIVIGSNEDRKNDTLYGMDIGISSQVIREYLHLEGYASMMIYSFDRLKAKELINIDNFFPEMVIAIGKSDQIIRCEDSDEEVGYYRNEKNEHKLRKLVIDKLIVK